MGCSGSKENHLRESISNGDIESVRTLVQNGHFKDSRDATGCTALHTASRVSQVEIVQLLLEVDVDAMSVNLQNDHGWTALMESSYLGNANIMMILLDKSAKLEITDQAGFTALILASAEGHSRAVDLLLKKGARLNSQNGVIDTFCRIYCRPSCMLVSFFTPVAMLPLFPNE